MAKRLKVHERPVHVEVCLTPGSIVKDEVITATTKTAIAGKEHVFNGENIFISEESPIHKCIESVRVDLGTANRVSISSTTDVRVHVFQLGDEEGAEELDEEGDFSSCNVLELPHCTLRDSWDSLTFEDDTKYKLLDYVSTALLFAEKSVSNHLVTCNRVILLHGPAGTGKTTLCKALSQKLAIRLRDKFKQSFLIEINAHSLFSKWFSESGKLVMKMFSRIKEYTEDEDTLVCVLIDEVESLTVARKASMSGTEPTDTLRAVNAVLTQLDSLKNKRNVLVLATSNITEAIDAAFIDRADIKQYIGLPGDKPRYEIIASCLHELIKKGLIEGGISLPTHAEATAETTFHTDSARKVAELMLEATNATEGLSGRMLRKLPFLAHALINSPSCTTEDFLAAYLDAAATEKSARAQIAHV